MDLQFWGHFHEKIRHLRGGGIFSEKVAQKFEKCLQKMPAQRKILKEKCPPKRKQ
jgi:hypothetical protein